MNGSVPSWRYEEAIGISEELALQIQAMRQQLLLERALHEATKQHLQRERERADDLARELESLTAPQT